jgi:hypothetical protein
MVQNIFYFASDEIDMSNDETETTNWYVNALNLTQEFGQVSVIITAV